MRQVRAKVDPVLLQMRDGSLFISPEDSLSAAFLEMEFLSLSRRFQQLSFQFLLGIKTCSIFLLLCQAELPHFLETPTICVTADPSRMQLRVKQTNFKDGFRNCPFIMLNMKLGFTIHTFIAKHCG